MLGFGICRRHVEALLTVITNIVNSIFNPSQEQTSPLPSECCHISHGGQDPTSSFRQAERTILQRCRCASQIRQEQQTARSPGNIRSHTQRTAGRRRRSLEIQGHTHRRISSEVLAGSGSTAVGSDVEVVGDDWTFGAKTCSQRQAQAKHRELYSFSVVIEPGHPGADITNTFSS